MKSRRPEAAGARARLLAGAILLAGCTTQDATPEAPRAPDSTLSPAPAPPRPTLSAEADTGATVVIEGEGLRVLLLPSGRARPIAFGTLMDETMRVLAPLLGAGSGGSTPTVTENGECNATVAAWPARGISLSFTGATPSARRFVGWSLAAPRDTAGTAGGSAARLTTASGIGIGSTRAALDTVYATQVDRSTLGVEFSAGGLAGILSATTPDARILNLWAGEVCLAR